MNELEQKLKTLKHTHLLKEEHEALRTRVINFMENTPVALEAVRNAAHGRHQESGASAHARAALNSKNKKSMIGLIIAGLFALSSGVSYAAEGSAPGDVLYPVKIHVNENVQGAFHVGAKEDAAFARTQLLRRAEEAKKLEAQNRLDAHAKATLAAEVKTHIGDFKKAEAEMNSKGDTLGSAKGDAEMQAVLGANLHEFLGIGVDLQNDFNDDTEVSSATNVSVSAEADHNQHKSGGILHVGGEGSVHAVSSTTLRANEAESDVHARENIESENSTNEDLNAEIRAEGEGEVHMPVITPGVTQSVQTQGSGAVHIGL